MDVGLRSVPLRTQQPAPVRSGGAGARGRLTAAVVVLLAVAVIGLAAWILLSALTGGPAVTAGACTFAVRAFAINRFGYGAAQAPWYDGGLAALQVAGYETVTGALRRSATAVTAAREATAVASLLAAIAVTVAARRLRLSGPSVVAVPLLFCLTPAALLLHRTADPTQLGVLWACIAMALAGGQGRRIGAAVASGAYLVAAVVTAPLVLIALVPLFAMLLRSGSLGRLGARMRLVATAVGLVASAGLLALAITGHLPGGGGAPTPEPGVLDWALAVAAIGAGIGGLWVVWLRPLAVALLVTAVAAAAAPDIRGSLVLVALPLAAVVLPAAVEAAVPAVAARALWLPRRPVVVGVLALVLGLAWIPDADRVSRPDAGTAENAVDQARAWVLTNLPSRPKLVVDDALWSSLVDAGYPVDQLAAASGAGPDRVGWPQGWRDAGYAVGRDDVLRTAPDPIGPAWRSSTPVAAFGADLDRVTIRRVVADPDAAATATREIADRVAAGRALAANPRLGLQPRAAELLRAGQVDARAVAVLAAVTGQHALQIVDFPVVPGEDAGTPRRLVAVSAIDNQTVGPGATVVTLFDQWLRAQQPPYRPAGTELSQLESRPVLLVRYDALGETGLLPP
jgi:hypothetical protein